MSDFDLDGSRWFNAMKVALAMEHLKAPVEVIAERAPILARFPYDAVAGSMLADTEDKLAAALDAVRTAREEYESKRPAIVAAE